MMLEKRGYTFFLMIDLEVFVWKLLTDFVVRNKIITKLQGKNVI